MCPGPPSGGGLALATVEQRSAPDPARVRRYVFSESRADGSHRAAAAGRRTPRDGFVPAAPALCRPSPQGPRINLVTAVRRTLEHELAVNPRHAHLRRGRRPQGRRARRHAWDCRRNSAWRESSTPACPRKASSAAPWAWPPPDSCRSPRFNFENMRIQPLSSSMTAARCAGAPPIDSPRPWSCASPAAFSSAAIPGTANRTKCNGCTAWAGGWPCPRMRRTRWACCASALARQRSDHLLRASLAARRRLGAARLSRR